MKGQLKMGQLIQVMELEIWGIGNEKEFTTFFFLPDAF